jgi:hypothetical protein
MVVQLVVATLVVHMVAKLVVNVVGKMVVRMVAKLVVRMVAKLVVQMVVSHLAVHMVALPHCRTVWVARAPRRRRLR